MPRATKSAAKTRAMGVAFARLVSRLPREAGALVLALSGGLGSGKTTFVRGFARGLGIRANVLSPTFVLMQPFAIPSRAHFRYKTLWHADCYRLERPAELAQLGFKEILKDPRNIVVIEWADKVRRLLPKDALWIRFEHGGKANERIIAVKSKVQISNVKSMSKSKAQTRFV